MPFGYPVMLELRGRRCVVIGDDAVREGKVEGLLAGGADDVLVMADGPSQRLDELARLEGVTVRRRRWRADEIFEHPLAANHRRRARGVRSDREYTALP